jgi:hypothetical protein
MALLKINMFNEKEIVMDLNELGVQMFGITPEDKIKLDSERASERAMRLTTKQSTVEVPLQDIVSFARENGYRIIARKLGDLMPGSDTIDWLLEKDFSRVCRCKKLGCGIDFRHTTSLDGVWEFDLVS